MESLNRWHPGANRSIQWIGFSRENLQETIDFPMKYRLNQSIDRLNNPSPVILNQRF